MAKGNGKTEMNLDLDRELPAAEDEETGPISISGKAADESAASETEKLKAERDALLDRLARLQAEFDNARKRAVREQQEFREYAAADVIKNFLPILDSFERALKAGGDSNSNSNSNSDPDANSYSDADPISDAVSDPDSGRRADGEGRHCDHAVADGPAVSM